MNDPVIEELKDIVNAACDLSKRLSDILSRVSDVSANEGTENDADSLNHTDEQVAADSEQLPVTYFGAPAGSGFECNSRLPSSSVKCLYEVTLYSDTLATFVPLKDKFPRFKMTPSLLQPVCFCIGEISEASRFEIVEKGELELNDCYWIIRKKCTIKCIRE